MKKEDILKRAQKENSDEREELVKNKAFRFGWICVSIVMLLIIVLRAVHNESAMDVIIILLAQSSAISLYQYVNLPGKRTYLILGVLGILGVIIGFGFLLSSYRVF